MVSCKSVYNTGARNWIRGPTRVFLQNHKVLNCIDKEIGAKTLHMLSHNTIGLDYVSFETKSIVAR
jgi:hypothetical protein